MITGQVLYKAMQDYCDTIDPANQPYVELHDDVSNVAIGGQFDFDKLAEVINAQPKLRSERL